MSIDLEIARKATLRPIADIAARAGIPADALVPYGKTKAKIEWDFIRSLDSKPDGALVLVTGISPTPAGEGKTTTSVGLGDALNLIGTRAMIALREPSLGPCFGAKGGATGGGHAQIAPADGVQDHDVNVMPEGGVSVNVAPATSAMFSPSRFFTTTV